MDQHLRYRPQIRCVRRQRSQLGTFKGQTQGNRLAVPSHDALLIEDAVLSQLSVDRFQIGAFWQRHEVVAASIAHQIFDTALLPAGMDIGKEGLKAIDTLEVYK